MWNELLLFAADLDDGAALVALLSLVVTFAALFGVWLCVRGARTARFTRDPIIARALDAVIPRHTIRVALLIGLPAFPLSFVQFFAGKAPVTVARAAAALESDDAGADAVAGPRLPYSIFLA